MFQTPIKNKQLRYVTDQDVVAIPPSPLMKKLGYGTGVVVYEMERSPTISNKIRSPWAVKKVTSDVRSNSEANQRIIAEADILRKLNHPNIVGFRAFVQNRDGTGSLAMEECNESLGNLIETRLDSSLGAFPSENILKVALDLINALHYLHFEALVLHCDVKSYNVLINGHFNICKLCDFGVSLPMKQDGTVDAMDCDEYCGTPSWCSPEVLEIPPIITSKADVYALGLVFWEMLALEPPPPPVSDNDSSIINLDSSYESDADQSKDPVKLIVKGRPPLPSLYLGDDYNYVLELFYCCTDFDYTKRPPVQDLVVIIAEIMKCRDNI